MNTYKKEILNNICYTELVYGRINKKLNLELSKQEIETLINSILLETNFLSNLNIIYLIVLIPKLFPYKRLSTSSNSPLTIFELSSIKKGF